jgi:hypothetical protein
MLKCRDAEKLKVEKLLEGRDENVKRAVVSERFAGEREAGGALGGGMLRAEKRAGIRAAVTGAFVWRRCRD